MASGVFYAAKAWPQTPQIVAAVECLPQFVQSTGLSPRAERCFVMTCFGASFVRAWVKAIIHPTPLQPITKLSQNSSLAFLLFRPMIAGRKYRIKHNPMIKDVLTDIGEPPMSSFLGLFSYVRRAARYATQADECL